MADSIKLLIDHKCYENITWYGSGWKMTWIDAPIIKSEDR